MVGNKERRMVDTEGMRSMMEQLPLEQRLEASVSLITFAVAECGKVVLALGRQCNTLKTNQHRMLDAVAGIVPTTKPTRPATLDGGGPSDEQPAKAFHGKPSPAC